ncbi:lysogenization regulator HflD [Pseudoxanthomonas broegbernensis]|uniref:High frequency lysogenization protein HflD homolog n=1 Tax=Pseudoxanthomonas broegbernensis TaxID=83619 RepID=A0A7V8K6H5_9GAMM|nr:high frequency lysogenization protein HflD [Pseudoxanthomonas broegbernensis]KAF1685569.1 lysogenization regulator HflD [Pseudoxanthomonas broegbernensis]MBB6065939.1 high frequency lysogenization protein [Pseudoxanthomonas broegbernensis]
MNPPYDDRVLALAGLAQALRQVRRIAETGQSETAAARPVLDSVFRIDADSTAEVYGGARALAPGLRLLANHLSSRGDDPLLPRLALATVQLERRFSGEPEIVAAVAAGIAAIAPQAEALDSTHPEVLSALGALYADTISNLRPRIMVQGNPHYLGQPGVVSEIRALLLAAVRSALLWRQVGGNQWQFLLARRAMLDSVARHLD